MAWIEDTGRRLAHVKHYVDDQSPNRRRLVTSVSDLHYHDGANWQDISEALEDDALTGYAHKADRMRHAIHVRSTGTRRWYPRRNVAEYVEFGRLQSWSGTAWNNVNLGTATRSGNQISFSTVNFDLVLVVNWNRVKITVVLKTAAAVRRLRWAISLNGLTYGDGELRSSSGGGPVGYVERPVAWDANGSESAPNLTINATYTSGYLEFSGDLSAAVLPITIDPTLSTPQDSTVGCTYTASGAADNNLGAASNFGVSSGTRIGLLRFDLSSIPAGSTCNSATLYLTSYSSVATANQSIYPILSASGSWGEGAKNNAAATSGECSWNYQQYNTQRWAGDTDNNGGTNAGCSVSGTDYSASSMGTIAYPNSSANTQANCSLNTTAVANWFGGTNYGCAIIGGDTTNRNWHSDDASVSGRRPYMTVDYTIAATTVALNAASITAGGQAVTVDAGTSGPVTVSLSSATISAGGQGLTVTPGAVTVTVAAAAITASGQAVTVVPGAVTVALGAAAISASAQALTVSPGAATVALGAAAVTASGQAVTATSGEVAPVTVSLSSAVISATGQAATVLPGAVTVSAAAASISASGQAVTVLPGAATVALSSAGITASGQNTTVIPGAVTAAMSSALLTAGGQPVGVVAESIAPVYVTLSAAVILSSGQVATVVPGAVTVAAGTALLALSGQALSWIGAEILPPAGRILVVDAENRTLTVSAEDRIAYSDAEIRMISVPAELRITEIAAEVRTISIGGDA